MLMVTTTRARPQAGFTLTELAVVLAIVGLLMGAGMMTLSAQAEQRSFDETQRRLQAAREALLAFALTNGRLPCPAAPNATGDEAPAGGACTNWYNGFLPARSIGFQPTDAQGYGLDAYANRIRYAVSNGVVAVAGPPASCNNANHFTNAGNLRLNGASCRPGDLDICVNAACTARVASQNTVAFTVFSLGKNGALAPNLGDEAENTDNDARFVLRTPSPDYDDIVVIVPAGVVHSRLLAAGLLP
jgi:prepilin-type N-terminal cleavage/methylation domain-containing protein